jgi:hypothetical protein
MLSAGFIPALCREAGFSPLFWDTRILFEVQPEVRNLFSDMDMSQAKRQLWEMLLCRTGSGMELNFALTPDTSLTASRLADTVRMMSGSLEYARRHEVEMRRYLRNAIR